MVDSEAAIRAEIEENLARMVGRFPQVATRNDWYLALAYTVRDRMVRRWAQTPIRFRCSVAHHAAAICCCTMAPASTAPIGWFAPIVGGIFRAGSAPSEACAR